MSFDTNNPPTDLFRNLRHLAKHPTTAPPHPPRKHAVIFVHGIFSCHETFRPLLNGMLAAVPALKNWWQCYFDYEYKQSILDNGKDLAETIRQAFPHQKPKITLVGHSMGGLVCRAAVLQEGDLGMVKRLIMLGTPNHGTLQTARLGLLAHLMRESAGVLYTVFARKSPGIRQLSEVGRTFEPLLATGIHGTKSIDYVSIPGLQFHDESGWLTVDGSFSPLGRFLTLMFEVADLLPGATVKLKLPHDGIVEEESVKLSSSASRFSERPAHGNSNPPFGPYAHVTHPALKKVDHVTVQSCQMTIELISKLITAPDLKKWRDTLAQDGAYNLYP